MLAGGITGNLKAASEREGSLGIECFFQCELMCIADGRMEEAGADTSIHFDYGRDPWSIADGSLWLCTVDVFPKASSNPPQFDIVFNNEALINVFLVHLDHKLDFFFEFAQFGSAKCNFVLTLGCPALLPVEGR